jgi:hypothetical protein
MTGLADHAVRRFAAHETFAPRFGWLKKAFEAVKEGGSGNGGDYSTAFLVPTAPVDLGVGKNMVNAIRYWAQAFGVTTEERVETASRALYAKATDRAKWLFGEDGVDPWLEQPATLWLLHWWLLRRACLAPTWWVAFYRMPSMRFQENNLVAEVERAIDAAGWESVNRSSIIKDIDCLTKMYAPRRSIPGSPGSVEDLLDSPFRELGILEPLSGEVRGWRFTANPRLSVPTAVVGYACLDYMSEHGITSQISTASLTQEPGAVGRALRLNEPSLVGSLNALCAVNGALRVTDTLGQRALVVDGDPAEIAESVINEHYRVSQRLQPVPKANRNRKRTA